VLSNYEQLEAENERLRRELMRMQVEYAGRMEAASDAVRH
jgi:hypothetical protein